jgi:hypothetical protein
VASAPTSSLIGSLSLIGSERGVWWYYVFESFDGKTYIYRYGRETENVTGRIGFNLAENDPFIIEKSIEDKAEPYARLHTYRGAVSHMFGVQDRGFPEKTMIAIG